MTQAEFLEAQAFAARNLLPLRRLEIQLARVCMYIAGNKDAVLDDFMIKMRHDEEGESSIEEQHAALDFKPQATRKV